MFTTDSRTERFLDQIGVSWSYENDVSFHEFCNNWDGINLGRSQAKVEAAVKEYGSLMDQGSAAPAPILWLNEVASNYEVVDGMQRLLAEEMRNPVKFSAYVISTKSEDMIAKVRVFANYRLQGGYQESSEWTLTQAVTLLVNGGKMSIEEVASFGGWSIPTVRDKKQTIETMASVVGVGGPEKVPDTILRVVGKHAQPSDYADAPTSIAGFMNDVSRMRLSAAEAEPYIEKFFSVSRSKGGVFSQFATKLNEFREDDDVAFRLADPKRKRYLTITPDGRVLRSLKAALTTIEKVRDESQPIADMSEHFHVTNKIRTALQQIERLTKKGTSNGKSRKNRRK